MSNASPASATAAEQRLSEELRAKEERLSFFLESAGLGTWDWDIQTGTLLWSDRCLEMFGLPKGTIMSYERFLEAVHHDDRQRIDQAVQRSFSEKQDYSTEMRSVWPDGSIHWIASRGRPYFDKSGRPVRMNGAVLDVTRLKQTEENLQQARADAKAHADNLAAVLDSIPALTFFTNDRECRTMSAGRLAREIFQFSENANVSMSAPQGRKLGFTWLENGRELTPDELPVQQAAATGCEVRNKQLQVRFPDGSLRDMFGHAVPLFDGTGAVQGAVGALLDITELKKTEEELIKAQARAKSEAANLAAILDSVPAITLIADDPSCRYIRTNRFGYEIAGLPTGVNVSASAPAAHRAKFKLRENGQEVPPEEAPLQKAALTGREVRNCELRLQMSDGREIELFGHAVPLFDDHGGVRGAVGAFLDVTAFKKTETELKQARAEAKAYADNMAAIFDAMPAAALFSHDRNCERVTSNRAAYELLRMPYGSNLSKSAPPGEQPSFRVLENGRELPPEELPVQKAAMTGRAVRDKELEIRFEDGSSIFEFGHAVPLFDEEGNVRGAVGAFLDITDRKVMEERLRVSTERFQIALRGTPITVFNQDLDLRYRWIHNPVGIHNAFEIIGKRDCDLLERPEDRQMVEDIKSEVLRTGVSYQGDMSVLMKGRLRHYHVRIDPQRDAQGRICGLTGATFDWTQRKEEEEERDRLSQQRQLALDAANMGWWHFDAATRLGAWDSTFKSIFRITADSMPAEEILGRIHPDDLTRLSEEFKADFNAPEPKAHFGEYRILLPDGSVRWIEMYAAAETKPDGQSRKFVSCSGTVCDVTERKQAQEELRMSEERYRTLFETMTEGFAVCELVRDAAGRAIDIRWLECNSAVERLTGLRRDHLVGHCASEIFPGEYGWWVGVYEGVVREKTVYRFEGSSESVGRIWDLTAFPYKDDRFAVLYQDITARKKAQDALRASESRYRELASSLDGQVQMRTLELQKRNEDLVRSAEQIRTLSVRLLQLQDSERRRIARELHDSSGQILTAIGLELANLAEEVRNPKIRAIAPDLARQVEESQRLVQMLHQELRTTSYLLHPPLLDEAGLSSAVSWYLQGLSERSGLTIAFDISQKFGRLSRDLELALFRIVQESLTNILRHSGAKQASVHLTREGNSVTLRIEDSGKGILPEQLAAIQSGASGLGIRAMRERLHPFGGELQISSSPSGTCVQVMIPLEKSGTSEQIEPAQAAI